MQYVKCTKKLPGDLSPDRRQELVPTVEPIHVAGGKNDLVANINLIRAHGSTLTPRQGSTKEWRTQMKEDFVAPRSGNGGSGEHSNTEIPSKQLQQERMNFMRTSAYLPLGERSTIPFAQPDADVHSRVAFPRYDASCYRPDRKDRFAAHPSRSNVVLDADKDVAEDRRLRATSTMHDQYQPPNVEAVGKLKTKDQRGENQKELMKSNWSYGAPDENDESCSPSGDATGISGRRGGGGGARSLAGAMSVAKQPLATRDDPKLRARLPAERAPEEVQLPSVTFLEGQSGKSAKYFSRVPFQSGCNLSSSTVNPSLLSMPGAGTTSAAAFPRYNQDSSTKASASKSAGAENMGVAVTLPNGKKQYVPSSVQMGDYEPTCYVTSQKSQFRGIWFDGKK
jgi:hypothetical protein